MIKLIYITGSGRSGSTLLEQILAQLPEFAAVGELRHLWHGDYKTTLCGCGMPFKECVYWQPILSTVLGKDNVIDFKSVLMLRNQVDRIRYLPYILTGWQPADYSSRYRQYIDILEKIYQHIQGHRNTIYIADSSKDISTLYLLAKQPTIELHVIHLVRDSRAVAYSWQRKRLKPQVTDRTAYMPTYSAGYAAWDWLYRNLLIEWGKSLYDTYHRIRYEDLVHNPAVVIEQLGSEIGLEQIDLSFIGQASVNLTKPSHTAWGNPMRFQTGYLTLQVDSAWQQKLNRKDKCIVTILTWSLLRRYRYL